MIHLLPKKPGSQDRRPSHSRALLLVAVMFVPCALFAQIPAIANVPENLPVAVRDPLAQTRTSLLTRKSALQADVTSHNAECGSVPTDSQAAQSCRKIQDELQTKIAQYAAAVKKFNDDVAAAMAAPKSQPVSGGLIRTGGAGAVQGEVFRVTADGRKIPIEPGKPIFLNDHITTGPNSRLQVMLLDESVFTLGPESDMVLDEFVYDPSTSAGKITAKITKGVFRFVTGKIARQQPDNMKVKVPTADLGFRGTEVEVFVATDGSGYIKLFAGKMEITETKTGRAFSMGAGQMATLNADGTISRPVPLPH